MAASKAQGRSKQAGSKIQKPTDGKRIQGGKRCVLSCDRNAASDEEVLSFSGREFQILGAA